MADTQPPVIDEAKLNDFGLRLFNVFEMYEKDRYAAEMRNLQNLRQFRGIYDPEVLALIPKDCSKAYPKLTRWKVVGTVARLMQMLFPQGEKNYAVKPSPMPDLPTEQLQQVLDNLVQATAQAQGIDPAQVTLEDTNIEKAVKEYASGKAERMELKVDDDLQEMDYLTLARKVVFSAVLYNIGVLKGPLHIKAKARTWKKDPNTGRYTAIEIDKLKPVYEFLPVWDYYPDMTAKTLDQQDGTFERHVMTRAQVEELADRPDFMGERIKDWLNKNKAGNYKAKHWETAMKGEKKSDKTTTTQTEVRKYEVLCYWGGVSGHELSAAGIDVKEEDRGSTFQANVWIIDKTVIKAKLAPLGTDVRHHHEFVFEEDDLSLLGNGQCDTLRDSQLSICELTRAALDAASVIGTNLEVNTDLVAPGTALDIRKHKVWPREGEGAAAQLPAVRNIPIDSHLGEITPLLELFLGFADKESGLPPPSLGDVSNGGSEALRTQQNASMFLGAAALPIRDTVRNFDRFTISVISGLVQWNLKYDPNQSRDGDHDVLARGSTSLIAKEVLAQSLDAFRQSISPDEAPHVKTRKLLIQRMKSRDLPVDDILEDEDKANATIQAQQQAQQKATDEQASLIHAQVQDALADAFKKVADARKADASVTTDVVELVLQEMQNARDHQAGTARTGNQGQRAAA